MSSEGIWSSLLSLHQLFPHGRTSLFLFNFILYVAFCTASFGCFRTKKQRGRSKSVQQQEAQFRFVNDETCCVEIFFFVFFLFRRHSNSHVLHIVRVKWRRWFSEFHQSSSRKIYLSNATKIFHIVVEHKGRDTKLRRVWRYVVSRRRGFHFVQMQKAAWEATFVATGVNCLSKLFSVRSSNVRFFLIQWLMVEFHRAVLSFALFVHTDRRILKVHRTMRIPHRERGWRVHILRVVESSRLDGSNVRVNSTITRKLWKVSPSLTVACFLWEMCVPVLIRTSF